MKKLLAVVCFLAVTTVWAIPEADYANAYQREIVPLLKQFKRSSFVGAKNIIISTAQWTSSPSADRCLVILPGRSEQLEKYAEVVHSLNDSELKGELVYFLMDHRGQGSSQRFMSQIDRGYVDDFDNYASDVKTFLDQVVSQTYCRETYLLAHSMGGGIAVDFLQKHPGLIDRAVLTSPMLKIQTKPYPYAVARGIVLGSMAIGRGKQFAIGEKPYNPNDDFASNMFTQSKVRFDMWMNLFRELPQTQLGGVTNRWVNEIMKGTKGVRARYAKLLLPLRVIKATDERYSEASEMEKLCRQAAQCEATTLVGKHEVLMEKDEVRNLAIQTVIQFLK
jgi:lysophospholipase